LIELSTSSLLFNTYLQFTCLDVRILIGCYFYSQGVENGIVPAGYIGLPANVQQFVGNQAAIRPSIVYMVPVC
jgi:hypothetical protein